MNAPFIEPAHSPFGGSSAARVLRCPASVNLTEKVPATLRRLSAYAMRGTALHTVMALLIEEKLHIDDLVGEIVGDYAVTDDDVETALRPAYAHVSPLLDAPGEFYLEHRVTFPGIANTFGTVDLIIRIGNTIHLIDHKFGSGVRVTALIPDGDEDVINAQLLFYAAAARHSLPAFFAGVDTIILTILQPTSVEADAEMVSSVEVTHAELDEFIAVYRRVCEEALSEAPRLERGAWCRFCAARPICPAHTGPLLDLAQFVGPAPAGPSFSFAPPPAKEAYLQLLAEDLDLARDDVVAETMRSPKQVETHAKARGLKVPTELISSHRSGVSPVRCENARAPVPGRGEIVRSFSRALEAFREGGGD